jgi:hypothetical protein
VKVWPPTLIRPVRVAPVLFPAENATQPLPLPLPDRTTSHDESLVAFHVQPDGAVILTLSVPPVAGNVLEVRPNW